MNDNIDGKQWQQYIEKLLYIKYGFEYTSIPDATQGDHGLEGFSKDGIAYQCYAADGTDKLYDKQRDKISADIKKLIENEEELLRILDQTKIKTWAFVVPFFRNKELLKHATKKANEIRSKSLKHIDANFSINIITGNNFWSERQKLLIDTPDALAPYNPWSKLLYQKDFYAVIRQQYREELSFFAESSWNFIINSLPENYIELPWFNINMPERLIDNISITLDKPNLNEHEIIIIYIVSILREIAINNLLSKSIEDFNPLNLEQSHNPSLLRLNYEYYLEKSKRFKRKIKYFTEINNQENALAIGYWLLRKSTINNPKTWRTTSKDGLFNYSNNFLNHFNNKNSDIYKIASSLDILQLTGFLFKEANSFDPSEEVLINEKDIIRSSNGFNIELKTLMLAATFSIVERMSFDIANLSDIIIDYFGIHEELRLDDLAQATKELNWSKSKNTFEIHITTFHPAIDYALRNQIDILNLHSSLLGMILEKTNTAIELPTRSFKYSTEKIRIGVDFNNKALFQVPHLSFKLSEEEVKDLLIGGSLYGDSNVAVRELYQNSLDACRYRQARMQYLARKEGGNPFYESEEYWRGEITFRKGKENGRIYIECQDNGIGMGLKELRESFTRAGKRYTDLKDYNEETFLWMNTEPKVEIYPNSQFGIGVFSYFLISDEIVVKTKRMGRDGDLGETIQLNIYGSGNLCKVSQASNTPQLEKGGTIIRMYLHQGTDTSPLHSLKHWLYIAEFKTIVFEDKSQEVWLPDILNTDSWQLRNTAIIPTIDPNVFFSIPSYAGFTNDHNLGSILQDGILISTFPYPFIVNFTKENKRKLTVNRNGFIDANNIDFIKMLETKIDSSLVQQILTTPKINFFQLSYFVDKYPLLGEELISSIRLNKAEYKVELFNDPNNMIGEKQIDILVTSILPFDHMILKYLGSNGSEADKLKHKENIISSYPEEIISDRIEFFDSLINWNRINTNSVFANTFFSSLDFVYIKKYLVTHLLTHPYQN